MDFKKLGNALTAIGAVVLVGAVVWWFSFYSSVVREIGSATGGHGDASVFDARSCLYSSSGICALVSGVRDARRQDALRAHGVLVRPGGAARWGC